MITTTIVTSKDGVGFSVTFYSKTEAQARAAERAEANFAATRLACELDSFGDYRRVAKMGPYVWAEPRPYRPRLTLIQGGKGS